MSDVVQAGRQASWQVPVAALAAALLFNLGQGVLRPTLPLYLQQVFAANYQMVTVIPLVFGVGKWVASLPTGYLLDRLERRRLMVEGLLVIAICDAGSLMTSAYGVFLGLRALADLPTALIGDRVAPPLQGVAIGWLRTMMDSGHILGPLVMGALADTVHLSTPFLLAAALLMAMAWRCPRQASPAHPQGPPLDTPLSMPHG
jgi:MFS transporter, ACDE family, multidrug resistance protein